MAKEYKAPKLINRIVMTFNRLGVGRSVTLVTTGAKSREPRAIPVAPIEVDGHEYIVAPYGRVGWVHNVRRDPDVELKIGRRARRARLVDVTGEASSVVMAYWERESFPRAYMAVPENPTQEDFADKADSFPVFRVEDR